MKYIAMDGYEMEARDYQELAQKLWQSMFNPDRNIQDWMRNSAKRAKIYNGSIIRTDTVEHHIEDFIKSGSCRQRKNSRPVNCASFKAMSPLSGMAFLLPRFHALSASSPDSSMMRA